MALARIEQARADVSGSQVYSRFTRIVAPINGVVVSRQADVGYMAAPGTPLLTIESGGDYRLEAAVQESQINKIQLGNPVRVQIDALGQQELAGTVVEIVPASDPASRTYLVKISIAVPGGNQQIIRSGLYGKARFVTGQTQAITIPRQAVVERRFPCCRGLSAWTALGYLPVGTYGEDDRVDLRSSVSGL